MIQSLVIPKQEHLRMDAYMEPNTGEEVSFLVMGRMCHAPYAITSILMIPGRNECYSGWNMEYHGYLSSGYYGYASSSSYACVEINPENLIGGEKNENGKLFYPVVSKCHPLQCPPYHDDYPLTCVVCSK